LDNQIRFSAAKIIIKVVDVKNSVDPVEDFTALRIFNDGTPMTRK
jgi:hypothetical protein